MGDIREIQIPDEGGYGRFSTGILPSHVLNRLIASGREIAASEEFTDAQIQPASIDLRLGAKAYRVRASFLPGPKATVEEKLASVFMHEVDLTNGAVLETGCVYIVPLLERAEFSGRVSGVANPKSSTGRIDVFTRLITDRAQAFDRVEAGYRGPLYAEISPRPSPLWCAKARASTSCASVTARRNSATHSYADCMPTHHWSIATPILKTAWDFPSI
jgi:dCTP deaminase